MVRSEEIQLLIRKKLEGFFFFLFFFLQVVQGGQEAGAEDVPLTYEIRKQTNPCEAGVTFVPRPNFRSRM